MLRECARYEALAKIMLHSDEFFNFFRYVEVSTFDIASDAFSTFKVSYIDRESVLRKHFQRIFFCTGTTNASQNIMCRILRSELRQSFYALSTALKFRKLCDTQTKFKTVGRTIVGQAQFYGWYFPSFIFVKRKKEIIVDLNISRL